jgi:molybdate transport system substrate-binding protein
MVWVTLLDRRAAAAIVPVSGNWMMFPRPIVAGLALASVAAFGPAMTAAAADIKVSSARLGVTVLRELAPQFERNTGHHLIVTEIYGPPFMKRLSAGTPLDADVVILRYDLIDALINSGRLRAGTRTDLFKTELGVEVRAGAPKPDISTVDGFRRALLDANSIAYLGNGLDTPYLDGLMQRLGIADQIKEKLIRPEQDLVSIMTAKGEVELGISIITQIMTTRGVALVGPLPPEIQAYFTFAGAVSISSELPDEAKRLLQFLTGPAAISVIHAQGMEPG